MRVLITGSSGFVGKHVVKELEGEHELVTPNSRELNLLTCHIDGMTQCEPDLLGDFAYYLGHNRIDAIVHLAATCGGIGINKDNPGKFIYENLQMGMNVLEAARLANIKKVVNLSSVCAYPKHAIIPFQEEKIWDGYPEETNAPYGIAKKTIMEMGIAYSKQYAMNVVNLVPVNMAGEYDNFDEYSSHVIPALIKKFENPQLFDNGRPIGIKSSNEVFPHGVMTTIIPRVELWGTGSASREFLDAKDCARAIAIALVKDVGPEPINLGTGHEITIADLALLIKRVGNYDAEIVWDDSKPDGQPRRSLNVSRAKTRLNWKASTPLEETVRRTIEWYRKNG